VRSGSLPGDLGDKRAGGIDLHEVPRVGRAAHVRGYAVCAVDHSGAWWHVIDRVDEGDAALLEFSYNVAVVDDLVEDVEGRALEPQHAIYALDGHVHAGAESAWVTEQYLHATGPSPGENHVMISSDAAEQARVTAVSRGCSGPTQRLPHVRG
jgi:hypothetical protein